VSERRPTDPADTDGALRYARQRTLREFGPDGQTRLSAARMLLVGSGGLGSPAALYLAAAGVGTLGLVDDDVVDLSNLHRQLLYGTSDVGRPKLEAAANRLGDVNPLVRVVLHETRLRRSNAAALVADYDLVIDGTDNFPARYAINDACVARGIPFVYGSVARFEGQVSVFAAPGGPCYRCLFPEPPAPGTVPSCAEEGVLGVMPGLIGLLQATEAIKWCVGLGESLVGRLVLFDALGQRMREVALPRRVACPVCGDAAVTARGSQGAAEEAVMQDEELTPGALSARLAAGEQPVLLDVREPWEHEIAALPGSTLIPLSTLAQQALTLDKGAHLVVYCHHGGRSAMAAQWLRAQGFTHVSNLAGGIDAWSLEVDASLPRY
jgi:molybdopterin/thiamine biosynthesis adenylyltransferase/rhodanese-related sulfurtransferase